MKNKKTIIQLVSFGIVCFLLGVTFVYAQISQTHVISGGIYPGASDYTAWTDDLGNFYAKNAYGTFLFTSTNASDVLQDTINLMTTGDSLLVKGNWTVANALTISQHNDTSFYFDGWLILGADITAVNLTLSSRCLIDGLAVDLNGFNGTGLQITGAWHNEIRGVYIMQDAGVASGSSGVGVYMVTASASAGTYFNAVFDVEVLNTDYGLYINDVTAGATLDVNQNSFYGFHTTLTKIYGFYLEDSGGNNFYNCGCQSTLGAATSFYLTASAVGNNFYSMDDTDHPAGAGYSLEIAVGAYNNHFIGGYVTSQTEVLDGATLGANFFDKLNNYNTIAIGTITILDGATTANATLGLPRNPWTKHCQVSIANWGLVNASKWYFYVTGDVLVVVIDVDNDADVTFSYYVNISNY